MSLTEDLRNKIDSIITSDDVVLFMKGNRTFPQCGFSATVVQILNTLVSEYTTVNVLTDPAIRQGIKDYSDWPTIPQLYVRGEFVGGCDIVREMFEAGELQKRLGTGQDAPTTVDITITDAAATALRQALDEADEGDCIHLSVDPSFQHGLDIGPKTDRSITVESNGLTIAVEPMSARKLDGTTIDYVDTPQMTGFKIDNPNRPPDVQQIGAKELKAKLDAGEIQELIDVRTPEERSTAQIDGSKLLDDEIMQYLSQIDVKTPIAFYCHHGSRSQAAAEHFRDRGFRNVYNLIGGIDAWSAEVDSSIPRY
ncbi:MAG: Grx4 family monothiol glutaredoxin [Proteobacteria bacterium]|nr:Grx4 family monothiol glutaredoxin [Pseudomonadota bacterium]